MRLKSMLLGCTALLLSLTAGFGSVLAADSDNNGSRSQIDIQPVIPDNQDGSISSYISLTPDGDTVTQDVSFKIKNGTDEKVVVNLDVLTGVTSLSGTISYTADSIETDKVVENYRMSNYLDMPESIELAPNELKTVTGQLSVEGVSGTLLGAVGFQVKDEAVSDEQSEQAVSIKNETKRVLGVVVNFDDSQDITELDVGQVSIERTPAMYSINLDVLNNNPVLFSRSEINYEVFDHKGESVFVSEYPAMASFTPKTNAVVSLPWQSETIETGKTYMIKGVIEYGEMKTPFEREFVLDTIKESTGKSKPGIFKPSEIGESGNNLTWLYVGLGLLVIGGIGFIVWRRNTNQD